MQLTIRMPDEHYYQIEKLAEQMGLKKSDVARMAIKIYINNSELYDEITPYKRAKQTFQIVQEIMDLKCTVKYDEDLIVFEDPNKILDKLEKEFQANPEVNLILVGHNPHLSTFQEQYLF